MTLQLEAQIDSGSDFSPLVCAREIQRGGQGIKTRSSAAYVPKEGQPRPIAKEFRHDRFQFRQIARENDIAIYEQRWIRHDGAVSDNVAYEVVKIRRHQGFTIAGHYVEPSEFYPNSKEWGDYGWTYTDKDQAFAKLRALCRRIDQP